MARSCFPLIVIRSSITRITNRRYRHHINCTISGSSNFLRKKNASKLLSELKPTKIETNNSLQIFAINFCILQMLTAGIFPAAA